MMVPVTTPVVGFGFPTVATAAPGALLEPRMETLIVLVMVPPWPSAMVTVNASALSAAVAVADEAAARAAAVGV
ncbi:MAG: hypothetical protein PGN37_05920 [Mycobacterium kyogaense]